SRAGVSFGEARWSGTAGYKTGPSFARRVRPPKSRIDGARRTPDHHPPPRRLLARASGCIVLRELMPAASSSRYRPDPAAKERAQRLERKAGILSLHLNDGAS